MRYPPEHKLETHRKIVKDAARRVRTEGLNGAAVGAVMHDTGLTHGGFYKHFASKEELLLESVSETFRETIETLIHVAQQAPRGNAWQAMVKTYLSLERCDSPEQGCPLVTLGSDLARVDKSMQPHIFKELVNYRDQMVPYMPGRRVEDKQRAFFAIFSTMIGTVAIARMLPEPAMRERLLAMNREFLLRTFGKPQKRKTS